jgi:hypothetical protein
MTSFFRIVNKRALAHAQVNVTDFSIGIIHCVRHLPSSNQSILRICTLRHITLSEQLQNLENKKIPHCVNNYKI